MKVKVFVGEWYDAMNAFNEWAKGKALAKDVLIQTSSQYVLTGTGYRHLLTICIFHPEDPFWDATKQEPISPIQHKATQSTGMAHEVPAQ